MAEVFEEESEQTVSIEEYIKGVEEQELEADLVLGGDEGKECTYSKGYMKRQAIFSCLTCNPNGNAGVCTACSLSCHEGHEILELWTKRNFRCDCGNSKFEDFFCKLSVSKDIENEVNSYNHNFKGAYCTCGRPYPDPDAEDQVEMMQCCICEDWFHEEHLGLESPEEIPKDEDGEPVYEDFICQACSSTCSFLTLYPQAIHAVAKQHDDPDDVKKKGIVEEACESSKTSETASLFSSKLDHADVNEGTYILDGGAELLPEKFSSSGTGLENSTSSGAPTVECLFGGAELLPERTSSGTGPENSTPNGAATVECLLGGAELLPEKTSSGTGPENSTTNGAPTVECLLGVDLVKSPPVLEGSKPMFLCKSWRNKLCRCETCTAYYMQKGVGFLLDKEDSIVEYEKIGKRKREENLLQREGIESNFLNKLGHVQKIEILNGIADMKNEFTSFLESFDSSKPITSADVQQVFENLAKKRRREP